MDTWDNQIVADMADLGAAIAVKGALDDHATYRQALTVGRNANGTVHLCVIDSEGAAVGIDVTRGDARFIATYIQGI